jgi:hypothetical protein
MCAFATAPVTANGCSDDAAFHISVFSAREATHRSAQLVSFDSSISAARPGSLSPALRHAQRCTQLPAGGAALTAASLRAIHSADCSAFGKPFASTHGGTFKAARYLSFRHSFVAAICTVLQLSVFAAVLRPDIDALLSTSHRADWTALNFTFSSALECADA